jgi:hypothetical protein
MALVTIVPRAGAISEIRTFECHICKTVVTEPATAPIQAD